jgi:autotransporter-associated beta strand protein
MKSKIRTYLHSGVLFAALLASTAPASAATVTWDSDGTTTSGPLDGTGDWLATGQWWDGAANVDWNNTTPDNAVIGSGGEGGTITLGSVTAGTVLLDNFTGTYTLSGGSLDQSGGVMIGTTAGNVTISSLVSGAGGLTKKDAGTLTLSGANTFSGQLTVEKGTLAIASINNVSANGTLGNSALPVILGSSGNTGTLKYTGGTATSTKPLTLAAGGTGAVEVTGNLTLSGLIDGSGALAKNGAATLTLSGTNTYTGGTTLNAGTLSVGADNNLGDTTANAGITFNGSAYLLATNNFTTPRSITLNNTGATAQISGNVGGPNLRTFTVSGAVTGSGGILLGGGNLPTKLILSNTGNNFTGAIFIGCPTATNVGGLGYRLELASLADTASPTPITFGYGNTAPGQNHEHSFVWTGASPLVLNNRYFEFGPVAAATIRGWGVIESANATADNTLTINTDLVVSGTGDNTSKGLTLQGANTGANTFAGKIVDGTGTPIILLKAGNGTWVVSGNNTFSGGTTVNAGLLQANGANALGAGNVTVSAGTLQIDTADAMADTATLRLPSATTKNLTMNANDTVAKLFIAGVQQPNGTYSTATNADAWMNGSATLTVGPASAQPVYWDLDDTTAGAGGATPSGIWNAANTYWNDAAGTGTAAAWTAGRTATFAAGSDATDAYTVTVDGTQDIGGLTFEEGTVALSGGTALRLVGDAVAYVNTGLTATVETPLTQDATARGLTKSGTGTLVLTGANAYGGPTALAAGTLRLGHADAIATSSELTISNGSVVLDTAATVAAVKFTGTTGSTLSGSTMNFTGTKLIEVALDASLTHTFSCGINGNPAVRMPGAGAANVVRFNPTGGNQALGVITNPYYDGSGDKAQLTLDGTTTGNTIDGITYQKSPAGLHYGYCTKQGTGTWTVNGNVEQGKVNPNGGTLIINGTFTSLYQGFGPIVSGARVGGNLTYFQSDSRFGHFTVNSGGIVAPGNPAVDNGVGTIISSFGTGRTEEGKTIFNSGAIYEWQVGAANATDKVHVARDQVTLRTRSLTIGTITLKILDAGGTPLGTDQLPVFTYDAGVVRTLDLGSVVFDTSALGTEWTIGTLALTDDGAGTIYLTGLSKSGGGNPYDTWAARIPDTNQRARGDDPDGDGFTNGEEFLFGTSPMVADGSLSTAEKSGGDLIIRWKERASGATYTLLQSATLNNDWVTAIGATLSNDGAAVGDYQPRKATLAIGWGKLFFRVQGVEN